MTEWIVSYIFILVIIWKNKSLQFFLQFTYICVHCYFWLLFLCISFLNFHNLLRQYSTILLIFFLLFHRSQTDIFTIMRKDTFSLLWTRWLKFGVTVQFHEYVFSWGCENGVASFFHIVNIGLLEDFPS